MAIAHVATEYMSSDFLPKDPNQARYRSLRTELAVEENSDLLGSGPALFPHLSPFAQEVSVGTQISCFAPTNFSWRQAANVDSYFWAVHYPGVQPTDQEALLKKGIDLLVIGKGSLYYLDFVKQRRIDIGMLQTGSNVSDYNKLAGQGAKVGGLFHSTC